MASPTDVTNLIAWWKADAITGLADGDPVATWVDSVSSPGQDATQATAGNRPTYQTNEINGLPVVRFDGTDDFLLSAASSSDTETTLLAVVKLNATATYRTIRGGGGGSGGLQWRITDTDKGELVKEDQALIGTGTGAVTEGAAEEVAVTWSETADQAAFYTDNVADGTASSTQALTAARTTTIGSNGSTLGQYFSGDIAELIVYNKVLSSAEMDTLHTYLQGKYFASAADATVLGVAAAVTPAAPAGTVSTTRNATVAGPVAGVTTAAPAGAVTTGSVVNVTIVGPADTYTDAYANTYDASTRILATAPPGSVVITTPPPDATVAGAVAALSLGAPAGTVSITEPRYIFRPPTVEEAPAGGRLPFTRYRLARGISVLLIDGVYHEVRWPSDDEIASATAVYRGGFENEVTAAEVTALTAAGYGDHIHATTVSA